MRSNRSQKRSTLASSSGASTSSSTQIGAGLVRNSAKINAIAVSACSPPDSSVSECSRLPGGWAKISSPASSGPSESTSARCAWPPSNSRGSRRRAVAALARNPRHFLAPRLLVLGPRRRSGPCFTRGGERFPERFQGLARRLCRGFALRQRAFGGGQLDAEPFAGFLAALDLAH